MLIIPALNPKTERYEALHQLLFKNIPELKFGIEVGVKYGETAKYLLENNNQLNLYLIDNYPPYSGIYENYTAEEQKLIKEAAYDNLKSYRDRILWMHESSTNASELIHISYADFCFIDADHSYAAVKGDCLDWYPKLRKGGILCGHDYCYEPVRKAVHEVFKDLKVYKVNCDGDIWAIEKE